LAVAALLSLPSCAREREAELLETGTSGPIVGAPIDPEAPYPPAVVAAIERVAEELSLGPEFIQVVEYEPMEWPDGCLGLPGLNEVCTAAITPGWRVVLKAEGELRTFRTDAVGTALREE
jgi:hypothetical protein